MSKPITDRRIWGALGRLTCCGYVDKTMQQELTFIHKKDYLRVEDGSYIMAYNNLTEADLRDEGLNMTLDELSAFLVSKGATKKTREKPRRRSYSLYD